MDRSLIESSQELRRSQLQKQPSTQNRYKSVKTRSPKKSTPVSKISSSKYVNEVRESTTLPIIQHEEDSNYDNEDYKIKTATKIGKSELLTDMMSRRRNENATVRKQKTSTDPKKKSISVKKFNKEPPRYTQPLNKKVPTALPEITPPQSKQKRVISAFFD